jgi:FixJ family two-component response regulator
MTKDNKIAHLSPREHCIARAWALGRTQVQIARELGCSRRTVSYALARPEVREQAKTLMVKMDELGREVAAKRFFFSLLADLKSTDRTL